MMSTPRKHSWIILLLLSLVGAGCATAGSGDGRVRQDLITQAEIEEVGFSNLYEVVQRLRPRWLSTRGQQSFNAEPEVVVFQGQVLLGGVETLRQLSPDMARSLRYLDGATASASLPGLASRLVRGAIVIEVKAGG